MLRNGDRFLGVALVFCRERTSRPGEFRGGQRFTLCRGEFCHDEFVSVLLIGLFSFLGSFIGAFVAASIYLHAEIKRINKRIDAMMWETKWPTRP